MKTSSESQELSLQKPPSSHHASSGHILRREASFTVTTITGGSGGRQARKSSTPRSKFANVGHRNRDGGSKRDESGSTEDLMM